MAGVESFYIKDSEHRGKGVFSGFLPLHDWHGLGDTTWHEDGVSRWVTETLVAI